MRQFGSISAGYVPPPSPPTDIMIFTQTGDVNPGKQDWLINLSGNKGPWNANAGAVNQETVMPVAGTFDMMVLTTDIAPSAGILNINLLVNATTVGFNCSVAISSTQGVSTGLTAHVNALDVVQYELTNCSDDVGFTASIRFTPD